MLKIVLATIYIHQLWICPWLNVLNYRLVDVLFMYVSLLLHYHISDSACTWGQPTGLACTVTTIPLIWHAPGPTFRFGMHLHYHTSLIWRVPGPTFRFGSLPYLWFGMLLDQPQTRTYSTIALVDLVGSVLMQWKPTYTKCMWSGGGVSTLYMTDTVALLLFTLDNSCLSRACRCGYTRLWLMYCETTCSRKC